MFKAGREGKCEEMGAEINIDKIVAQEHLPMDYERINQVLEHVYANAKEGDALSVLAAMDDFCYEKEWCMNIGDVKGPIVKDIIAKHNPKVIVELGGYYGYSAIMFASLLQKGSVYYTIEINPVLACVIEKTTRYAGLGDRVRVLTGDLTRNIQKLKDDIQQTDLFFLDHKKEAYLSDFLQAEARGLFHDKTVIVADNVVTPGAPDYIEHLMNHRRFRSSLVETELEYTKGQKEDAILVSLPVQ